jgi:pepF/M3 family oligoendopeptidase
VSGAVSVFRFYNPGMSSAPLPRWDLSNVYPGLDSPELKKAIATCEKQIKTLERFADTAAIRKDSRVGSAAAMRKTLDGYLDRVNAIHRLYGTVRAYLYSFVSTDSRNQIARKMLSEIEPLGVRMSAISTRFEGWLGSAKTKLPGALKSAGQAHDHAFWLTETAAQSKFLMSEPEEHLASALSLSGASAWGKLQGNIVSQLSVPFERNGVTESVSIPALINIMQHDPDAATRKRAYEAELAAWKTVEEPLAAAMNGVKGTASVLNQKRGFKRAIEPALLAARIDAKTLDAMMGAMRDSFPMFRKYLRAKAARLGHTGGLPWYDLMAPVGHNERHFSWDECRDFILRNFGGFSPRLEGLARRAFDNRWIDAEQRAGKRAGAFCMGVPAVEESRILCNFDGSLDQLSTVAHELGHAFHNECLNGKPELRTVTPMTLAETASIFCETIIIDAALDQAAGEQEALGILETDLIGKTQVIVDITSRFLFETEVFERRAKSELSADELSEIMLRCQTETYGEGLHPDFRHKYMWTWKPHYYYAGLSFYNFPYAFGLLFGLGLYAIYKQRGPSFVPAYESLLASTGEADAATLAKRFKIDIRGKRFWQDSLNLIGERIERYCAIP